MEASRKSGRFCDGFFGKAWLFWEIGQTDIHATCHIDFDKINGLCIYARIEERMYIVTFVVTCYVRITSMYYSLRFTSLVIIIPLLRFRGSIEYPAKCEQNWIRLHKPPQSHIWSSNPLHLLADTSISIKNVVWASSCLLSLKTNESWTSFQLLNSQRNTIQTETSFTSAKNAWKK